MSYVYIFQDYLNVILLNYFIFIFNVHMFFFFFAFLEPFVIMEYENMLNLVRIYWLRLLWFFIGYFKRDKILGIVSI
jgi:hypothetical protein